MMNAAAGIFLAARRKPKLPYAEELDYLDSAAAQNKYFDLGIKPDFSAIYEFETIVYDTNYQNKIICGAIDSSPMVWFFIAQTFNAKLDLNYGTQGTDDSGSVAFINNQRFRVKSIMGDGIQRGWVQNLTSGGTEQLVTNTTYPAYSGYSFQSYIRLFNRTNFLCSAILRMGRTTLKINGELLYDLVPCITFEGVYTFYNQVTKTFLTKTGNFTGGHWN